MAVQTIGTKTNIPFQSGSAIAVQGVIAQDAARSTTLAQFTLMGKIAASGKWTPLTDLAAVTGVVDTLGIYVGDDIAAATLVAGDVENCKIIKAGFPLFVDPAQLVLENSLTLDDVASVAGVLTVEDILNRQGIFTHTHENIFA